MTSGHETVTVVRALRPVALGVAAAVLSMSCSDSGPETAADPPTTEAPEEAATTTTTEREFVLTAGEIAAGSRPPDIDGRWSVTEVDRIGCAGFSDCDTGAEQSPLYGVLLISCVDPTFCNVDLGMSAFGGGDATAMPLGFVDGRYFTEGPVPPGYFGFLCDDQPTDEMVTLSFRVTGGHQVGESGTPTGTEIEGTLRTTMVAGACGEGFLDYTFTARAGAWR